LILLDRVKRYVQRHSLWTPGMRVVAAVSGGSDSVALAFLLRELTRRGDIAFAGLAHLNHHIRPEADADAAFVRALADRLGVPVIVADADVPAEASQHGVSIEVAARQARQRFFREALHSVNADRIAVAHTRDDQAETVVLRLTRGAGGSGLAAMAPRREHIVRPLLDVTRHELREYLRGINESWREDATNEDRSIPRNLVRHEVMPQLRKLNAQAESALARAAEILRGEDEFLERLANAAFLKCVEVEEQGARGAEDDDVRVTVDLAEFAKLPRALARRVARYALETVNESRAYGLEEVDELCRALEGGHLPADVAEAKVAAPNIPGLSVERFAAKVVLTNTGVHRVHGVHGVHGVGTVQTSVDPLELRLDIPGTVEAPRGAWSLTARGPIAAPESIDSNAAEVMIDAKEIGSHLIVRYRRPGDRLQPLGAPGRKKVQDVLVDRKVPRDDRDAIPIVTTQTGDIVWVAGQVLADPFRVTPLTKSVVVLTLRR
jgi:tRNA(Ile)-lysidine synthase